MLSCSGTGAMEAVFQNLLSPGDQVLTLGGGKFADRWHEVAKVYGFNAVHHPVEWGKAVRTKDVQLLLEKYPQTKAVVCVACETSTGVRHPYESIAALLKERHCLCIVDGISAVGAWEIHPEQLGIDALVFGSQKALMTPPGLGFVYLSQRAWQACQQSKSARYYFDFLRECKAQSKNQTAFTPAVSLIVGLSEALSMMQEEGKEAIFARHKRMAHATKEGVLALHLEPFAEVQSESITSICTPKTIDANGIYETLRVQMNLTVAEGQEHLKKPYFSHCTYGLCG